MIATLTNIVKNVPVWLGNFLFGFLVMVFSLFYFLADGPEMIRSVSKLLPLKSGYQSQLLDEFQSVSIPFVLGIGAPAWWLGYLALLARHDPGTGSVEWYPAGSLVFWSAILGAAVMLVVIPFYGMDLQTFHATLRKVLETALRRAIATQELYLEYQPIVDLATGQQMYVEALLRWRHPGRA